ncbi:MAG: hypothetical protein UMU76_04325 [Prosthecochloris sp.]|nr:hypothetical protein [Prosthecochloris sp.]
MNSVTTQFGELHHTDFRDLYATTRTDGCLVKAHNTLDTPYGTLVPMYSGEDQGRRPLKPLSFYKNGALKSLPLQSQTLLDTPAGRIPAELVLFYPSGALKKVFPLDGRLSGFWSWQNELKLAEELDLGTPAGNLSTKLISITFYERGAVKSLTMWPGQTTAIMTPYGETDVRKGIAFYENGAVRSFEPLRKTTLPTPLGMMVAYDNEPNGIHGDINSVELSPDGLVTALSTIDNEVEVIFPDGNSVTFTPGVKNNVCGDERKVSTPMKLRFENSCVIIDDSAPFSLEHYRFILRQHKRSTDEPRYSCTG